MLATLMQNRRSVRSYKEGHLDSDQVWKLVYAGIGHTIGNRRVVPSAGGCYPLRMYLVIGKVTNMEPGLYCARSKELIRAGDFRQGLCDVALGQQSIANAQMDIIIAANYDKITPRYHGRGVRYAHIEVGHIGQNIALQAVELGLGTVMIGAFNDNLVKEFLGIQEEPVYIIPVGLLP